MKKLKEIGFFIAESVSVLVWLLVALAMPYSLFKILMRVFSDNANLIEQLPIYQQLIVLVVGVWTFDLLFRPIITKILNMNIDRLIRVFAWQPFKKDEGQEGVENARCTTATAKDA